MFEKVIIVPKTDLQLWNETAERFVHIRHPKTKITLLHSLLSLSLWESKWHMRYFSKTQKTEEQTIDYIRCMIQEDDVDPAVLKSIKYNDKVLQEIADYIDDPMTGTTINDRKGNKTSNEEISAETIYWAMIQHGIPVEFERWHLNKLLMLIRVCNAKSGGGGKMNKKEIISEYAKINEMNRARFKSKG